MIMTLSRQSLQSVRVKLLFFFLYFPVYYVMKRFTCSVQNYALSFILSSFSYSCFLFCTCFRFCISVHLPTYCRRREFLCTDRTQTHTHTHSLSLDRSPLNEGSAYRCDFYLTTRSIRIGLTPMHPVAFEPRVSTSERPQTHAIDRMA